MIVRNNQVLNLHKKERRNKGLKIKLRVYMIDY